MSANLTPRAETGPLQITCPTCGAPAGAPCVRVAGPFPASGIHRKRIASWKRRAAKGPLFSRLK